MILNRPSRAVAGRRAVARRLGEFKAQNLANALWAYAKMGRPPAAALQARIDARKMG